MQRRRFLKATATSALSLSLAGCGMGGQTVGAEAPLYEISLAEWSLHRAIFDGPLDHLDFAPTAREEYGIDAVEYVSQFFDGRVRDRSYLKQLKARAEDAGVRSLLIMVNHEGRLGAPDETARIEAARNHRKWLEAARFLGGHSLRVNAKSEGAYDEQQRLAADGLRRLCEIAEDYDLNILVENHGGLSSNGAWLAAVIERVDHPLAGTLPDFGNFRIAEGEVYDRYEGVREMMPHAEAISAKSYAFDEAGAETTIDYERMMQIVLAAGYHGHVGIEYEGEAPEPEGIRATKRLLERTREQLASDA